MSDPRICNVGLDANALDEDGPEKAALVRRFKSLAEAGRISIVVPGGVRSEVQNPRTPGAIQDAFRPRTFNSRPGLNHEQRISRIRVRAILRGDAQPGKHDADASHLCEAAETGCVYFITHDRRILRKRPDLRSSLPSLSILTIARFVDVFDQFEPERPGESTCTVRVEVQGFPPSNLGRSRREPT